MEHDFAILSCSRNSGATHVWHPYESTARRVFQTGQGCWALAPAQHSGWSTRAFLACIAPHNLAAFSYLKSSGNAVQQCAMPEVMQSMCVTMDGRFLYAGGESGRVYAWELTTGMLLRCWTAHLSAVRSLTLSDDEHVLFSGGEDGMVTAWLTVALCAISQADKRDNGSTVAPFRKFDGHGKVITGISCGFGGPCARILTCSEDRTARIWHLGSGWLLATVLFSADATCCCLGTSERDGFVGLSDGRIASFVMSLTSTSAAADSSAFFVGHNKRVNALDIAPDGRHLISASDDGSVRIWDIFSRITMITYVRHGSPVHLVYVLSPCPQVVFEDKESSGGSTRLPNDPELPLCRSLSRIQARTEDEAQYNPSVMVSEAAPPMAADGRERATYVTMGFGRKDGALSAIRVSDADQTTTTSPNQYTEELRRLRQENQQLQEAGHNLCQLLSEFVSTSEARSVDSG